MPKKDLTPDLIKSTPLIAGASPYPTQPSSCDTDETLLILEPEEFSPDSFGWYGGIDPIEDPYSTSPEAYVGTITLDSQLGVEFDLPTLVLGSDNGLNISSRYVNASVAGFNVQTQYQLSDGSWNLANSSFFDSASSYLLTFIDGVLNTVPFDTAIKLRVLIIATNLTASSGIPELRVNHVTIGVCGVNLVPSPPSPPISLSFLPPSPDTPGSLPPFIFPEPFGPPLPPGPPLPVSPPLPPGSEILRPNRDISISLWNPRPVFMQLNDPLYLADPYPISQPLYAPSSVDLFNENTGNYIQTLRARLEVGLTAPVQEGPWDALQLRFRAARSRPPQPEDIALPLPLPDQKEAASTLCPPAQTLTPRLTDFAGNWQLPPLEDAVLSPISLADGACYISCPVSVPPQLPAQIAFNGPTEWDAGWDQITIRLVARARTAFINSLDSIISGLSAQVINFTPTTAGLPPGGPNYQVRWNPLDCTGHIHAFPYSPSEIRGMGTIQSNLGIHAEFFISSQDSDNVTVQVSNDGINYYGSITFDLGQFQSTLVYYRIALNNNSTITPIGDIFIGVGLQITGPYVVTPINFILFPAYPSPFILSVVENSSLTVPLTSLCRLQVALTGNMVLQQSSVQYTEPLTSSWLTYTLTWIGFWDNNQINDLRCELTAEGLNIESDGPFIDIDALEADVYPYCPGISPPLLRPSVIIQSYILSPVSDVLVNNWSPTPCWVLLISDLVQTSTVGIQVNPQLSNQLIISLDDLPTLPSVLPGYQRYWVSIEAIVRARINTYGSSQAILSVSTNFGADQVTSVLLKTDFIYTFIWNYTPGLDTDQINRLNISLIASETQVGYDPLLVIVSGLQVKVTYQDVSLGISTSPPPSPPPPPPSSAVVMVSSTPEVFSCGSLGDCSVSNVGRPIGVVTITNPDVTTSVLSFVPVGGVNIRVFDSSDTEYGLTYTMAGSETITLTVFGWVGGLQDSFPVNPENGQVLVSLDHASGIDRVSLPWFYIGW